MTHRLTIGHLDPEAVSERQIVVGRPLDMAVVGRLLGELGGLDELGRPTLDGDRVEMRDGYLVIPWMGGWTNLVAEEFALRLKRETGCLLADLEHDRIIAPEQLQGLEMRSTTPLSAEP